MKEMLDLHSSEKTPFSDCDIIVEDSGWWKDKLEPLPLEWTIIYLNDSIEAQIYREMKKGLVLGHFC